MKGPAKNAKIGKSMAGSKDEDISPLCGKPYFDFILGQSNLEPKYMMFLPAKICPELTPGEVPVVLTCRGKKWDMFCSGDNQRRFKQGWKFFVNDNNLKIGDGLVFELLECSRAKMTFKVQILRGDFPAELTTEPEDGTPENPIVLL
nr:PREDICTED: B3 domain-containing protein Os04g0386900-like [Nicotiana sylvestris]